jgi:ribosomal protein S6
MEKTNYVKKEINRRIQVLTKEYGKTLPSQEDERKRLNKQIQNLQKGLDTLN